MNTTQSMIINGFGGDENVNLGDGTGDGDTIANVADVTYDPDAHITNEHYYCVWYNNTTGPSNWTFRC